MTSLLERAVAEVSRLPEAQQDAVAAQLLADLEAERAWDRAFAADRPVVIDCVCDPTIPTLPPKITASQRNNYFKTLMKGDPDEAAIIKNAFKRYFTS